jgi:hypothetical protein
MDSVEKNVEGPEKSNPNANNAYLCLQNLARRKLVSKILNEIHILKRSAIKS